MQPDCYTSLLLGKSNLNHPQFLELNFRLMKAKPSLFCFSGKLVRLKTLLMIFKHEAPQEQWGTYIFLKENEISLSIHFWPFTQSYFYG